MGVYRNSKIWALFNGTVCYTNPRPPERGVAMFRNSWRAFVTTEMSNAPAAWACDSDATLSHSNLLDSCARRYCISHRECQSPLKSYAKYVRVVTHCYLHS